MAIDSVYLTLYLTDIIENRNADIIIYPNPVKNELNIAVSGQMSSFEVYSCDGRLVKKDDFQNFRNSFVIDVSAWPKGLYLVKVRDKEGKLSIPNFVK